MEKRIEAIYEASFNHKTNGLKNEIFNSMLTNLIHELEEDGYTDNEIISFLEKHFNVDDER